MKVLYDFSTFCKSPCGRKPCIFMWPPIFRSCILWSISGDSPASQTTPILRTIQRVWSRAIRSSNSHRFFFGVNLPHIQISSISKFFSSNVYFSKSTTLRTTWTLLYQKSRIFSCIVLSRAKIPSRFWKNPALFVTSLSRKSYTSNPLAAETIRTSLQICFILHTKYASDKNSV